MSTRLRDSLFLGLIGVFCAVPSLRGLGFYSDDWFFLARWSNCSDQSYWGLVKCFYQSPGDDSLRPVQILHLTVLYRLFGQNPLGYHVVMSTVFVGTLILLYITLREYEIDRMSALAVSIIYGFLPHYSTDRFWTSAAQATLCMTFCFFCFYAIARCQSAAEGRRWAWIAASVLAQVASIFTYEVATPLMSLIPFLLYFGLKHRSSASTTLAPKHEKSLWIITLSTGALVLTVIIKLTFQTRRPYNVGFVLFLRNFFPIVSQSIDFNIAKYGLGLPIIAWNSMFCRLSWQIKVATSVLFLAVVLYLYFNTRNMELLPKRARWIFLISLGALIFALGYSIFAPQRPQEFVNFGVDNRLTIAASLGTAFILVGLVGLICSLLRNAKVASLCFCGSVALIVSSGFAIIQGISSYWTEASAQQKLVLGDIFTHMPKLPPRTVLLIDGICAYVGPGIVFETWWDASGALQLLYRDSTVSGNVITSKTEVERSHLSTFLYEDKSRYDYHNQLWIYNYRSKQLVVLATYEIAQKYFAEHDPRQLNGCSPAREGFGAPVCFLH
jgi:hypothetical protein